MYGFQLSHKTCYKIWNKNIVIRFKCPRQTDTDQYIYCSFDKDYVYYTKSQNKYRKVKSAFTTGDHCKSEKELPY